MTGECESDDITRSIPITTPNHDVCFMCTCRAMSRLALIPFHSTPQELQLEGPARDKADEVFENAMDGACEGILSILQIGDSLEDAYCTEFPDVIARIRKILPQANTRLHRSYAWLTLATLKVNIQ